MKNFTPLIFVAMALISTFSSSAQSRKAKNKKPSTNFTIQTLAPGVWAAITNDNYGKAICNAGIIDLGDKTLVFDPFMTPQAARELREVAEQLTRRPVSIVVNSHYHNDHIRGNQVFIPEASIISTNFTRTEIARIEPTEQQWEARHAPGMLKAMRNRMTSATMTEKEELPLWIGYYEGMVESANELKMTLPDIVFNDSLWIMGSERDVILVECKDGHTSSDAVLIIPTAGIVFMGDLLFAERHPWISDGKPDCWQKTLKKFYESPGLETFIPGHGPVSKKEALKQLYDYLGTVQELASGATNDSLQTVLMQQPIPQPFQHWYFGRFYQPNLQFLFGRNMKKPE